MELTLNDAIIKAEVASKLADKAIDMAMSALLKCKELEQRLEAKVMTQATETWKADIERLLPDEDFEAPPQKENIKLSPFSIPAFDHRAKEEEVSNEEADEIWEKSLDV